MSALRKHCIFSLYGPTQSGKSRLIGKMIERLGDRLAVVRSVTTRPKRGVEDEANYSHHLSNEEFDRWVRDGRIVQWVPYAGKRYGTARDELDAILARAHGICAMVEDGMTKLSEAGYDIIPIQVVPVNQPADLEARGNDTERAADDAERARRGFRADVIVVNDFAPGRFATVADALERDILSFMDTVSPR